MNFTDFDKNMRVYEQALDQVIVPGMYMVARLDGRSFTKLTKETCNFEAPFDHVFRDLMVNTMEKLMNCGFNVIYGYTESDEISLLFAPNENTFGRKVRKYNSTLAAEASAFFSMQLEKMATFDCRMVPLPNSETVQNYFLWRQEDSHRNSLNAYCYWTLRKEGKSVHEATKILEGKNKSFKNELLFSRGINYNELPSWTKRGIGLWKEQYEKAGYNPKTNEYVNVVRNKIKICYDLPIGDKYAEMIKEFLV